MKEALPRTQSKFCGIPYFPQNIPYPTGEDKSKLFFLAQINLSEVPQIDSLPLPKKGLMQFFIAHPFLSDINDTNLIGGKNVHVLYHADISEDITQYPVDFFPIPSKQDGFPIVNEFSLEFEKKKTAIPLCDYRFENLANDNSFIDDIEYDELLIEKTLGLTVQSNEHRIGGYPYFTQFDPREKDFVQKLSKDEPFELLFQMTSQDSKNIGEISWGDAGVVNFFIKPSYLKRLDFSQVLYTWDCG